MASQQESPAAQPPHDGRSAAVPVANRAVASALQPGGGAGGAPSSSGGSYAGPPRVRSTPPDSNADHDSTARPGLYMPAKSGGIAPPGPAAASLLGAASGAKQPAGGAAAGFKPTPSSPANNQQQQQQPLQGGQRGPMQQQPQQQQQGTPQRVGPGAPQQFSSPGPHANFSPQHSPTNQQQGQQQQGQQQPQRGPMGGARSDQQFPRNVPAPNQQGQQPQNPQQQGNPQQQQQQRLGAPGGIIGNNPQQQQQPGGNRPQQPQQQAGNLTPQQLAQQFQLQQQQQQQGQPGGPQRSPFLAGGGGQPGGNPSNLSLAPVLGGNPAASGAGGPQQPQQQQGASGLNPSSLINMQQLLAQHQQQHTGQQAQGGQNAALHNMLFQQFGGAFQQQHPNQPHQQGPGGPQASQLPFHMQQQLHQMSQASLVGGTPSTQMLLQNIQQQHQQQAMQHAFMQQQRAQQYNLGQQQFGGMQRGPGGPQGGQPQLLAQQQYLLQQRLAAANAAGGPGVGGGLGMGALQGGPLGGVGGGPGQQQQQAGGGAGGPRGFPPAGMPPGVGAGQTFPQYGGGPPAGLAGSGAPQRGGMQLPGGGGGLPNVNAPTFNPGAVNVHGAQGGVGMGGVHSKPFTTLPSYTGPPASGGGLSAGPGAVPFVGRPRGDLAQQPSGPPVVYERKPLAITDDTGKEVDLSDLKKPEPVQRPSSAVPVASAGTSAAASTTTSASPIAPITQALAPLSSSPHLTATGAASGSGATTPALDLSDTDTSTVPLARKPLAIVSPSKYVAGQSHFKEEIEKTAAPAAAASSTASSLTSSSASSSSVGAQSSSAAPSTASSTSAASSSAASSVAASSTGASSSSASSTGASSSGSSTSTLSAPTPYTLPTKRAVMSLSPQPGAGSGLAPSVSSEALSSLRSASNASPSLKQSEKEKEKSGEGKEGEKSDAAEQKEEPKARGPILPLSGAGGKLPYAPRNVAANRAVRSLKSESGDSAASSERPERSSERDRSSPTAASPSPSAVTDLSKEAKEGVRIVNGRRIYDTDFLMSFKDLLAKPHNFPSIIQPEIEVHREGGSTPSARTGGAGASGRRSPTSSAGSGTKKDGPGDGQWSRGQTLAPQAGARGSGSMAPQGGRGLFAQAGARAVMADQQRSRDSGPIKPMERRDGGRDDRGRDSRDSRGSRNSGGGGGGRDGGRDGGRGGDRRGDGGRGGNQGPPYLEGPIVPLQKNANRWQVGAGVSGEMERIKKRVQGLLNKLALDKFDTLTHQLTDLIVENRSEGIPLLSEIVSIIFDKALAEQFFSSMYADLCVEVSKAVAPIVEFEPELAASNAAQQAADAEKLAAAEGATPTPEEEAQREREAKQKAKKSPFRTMLLSKCQLEFEVGIKAVERDGRSADEILEAETAQKRRFLGNIKFIGELYKKGMLLEKIMHMCIAHLIGNIASPVEEDLEAVCNLLTTIGKSLDHEKARPHMNSYFDRFAACSKNMQLSSRTRFMCLDLIDLRRSGWVSKRRPAEVKTLEQVRKEAAIEAQQKEKSARIGQFGGRPSAASSFRPMTGGVRGGAGGQDVRAVKSKPDRYAAFKAPTTPVSTAQPPPSFPATPVGGANASAAAAKPAAAGAAPAGGAFQVRKGSASAAPADAAPSAPVDAERAASLIRTVIQEYIAANDIREARAGVEELHAPELHFLVVREGVTKALSENKSRVRIAELCTALFEERLLMSVDFERGLTEALALVDADIISDECPKAAEFLGDMLGRWVDARCLDFPVVVGAAAHLIESGETANMFVHTCRTLMDLRPDDAHTVRTLIESGGVDVLALVGQENAEGNMKEIARLFERKPFMLQLFPTATYESDLRHALQQAVSGPAAPLATLLAAHASEHSNPLFLRAVVQAVLSVAGPDASTIGRLFTGLHSATGPASMPAQLGAMQTVCAFFTSTPCAPGMLRAVFDAARQSKLVSDPSVWPQLEDDAQALDLQVPSGFKDALQALSA